MDRSIATRRHGAAASVLLTCVCALYLPLSGCSDSNDEAAASPAPPSPPSPPPEPPPPEPPAPPTNPPSPPPLAATAVSIDDGHQIGVNHWPSSDTSTGGLGQPVDGLSCGDMVENYHVHTHLSIFLNGEALAVPAQLGIVELSATEDCHYNIHTHDKTGKLHVEAPAPGTFTLGQFFNIWGQPLERDNVGGLVGLPVVVYVTDDGVVSEYTGDMTAIELTSHRLITIQIGTPAITEVPNITWTGD